jgi:predicted nucleic acid-binding protein
MKKVFELFPPLTDTDMTQGREDDIHKESPDFFIGAQAAVFGMDLITRDVSRYHTYFPTVRLISPEMI